MAVDQSVQGGGLGKLPLMDALKRCLELSQQLGIHAVEVDAEKFGFVTLQDYPLHLYLPVRTFEAAFPSMRSQ